jgi:hypothetical protein
MTDVSNIRVVRSEIAKGSETLIYTEILYIEDLVCQIEIASDFYRAQCHARATVWSDPPLKWSYVTSIPYSLMKTQEGLAYHVTVVCYADFKADRDELITRLLQVLFPDLNSPSHSGVLTSSPN